MRGNRARRKGLCVREEGRGCEVRGRIGHQKRRNSLRNISISLPKAKSQAKCGLCWNRGSHNANVFYRAGIIERWGTGTLNIIDWCAENGNPAPTWQEQAGSVYVTFLPAALPDTPQVGTKLGLSRDQVQVIHNLLKDRAITDLMELLGRANRTKFRDQVLNPLIRAGFVEMTISDKLRSGKQKYRLTEKGRKVIQDSRFKTQD